MKKTDFLLSPRSFTYLPLFFLLIIFSGCEKEPVTEFDDPAFDLKVQAAKDKAEKVNEFYGPAQPFGLGVVRSMVRMNHAGEPVSIGVRISEKVLEDLPQGHDILTLRLSNKAEGMAFDHIDLDWNPEGHEPPFLYAAPHFDVHFYMISPEEKMQITDPDKAAILPEPEYVPQGYFLPAPDLVPFMGVHWLSSDAPELGGADFTHTFIYGSYDGSFIFMEPMITLDYLVDHADGTEFPIAQPQEFEISGWYPTTYSMDYDAKRKDYIIQMSGMVWRD